MGVMSSSKPLSVSMGKGKELKVKKRDTKKVG
jgi:hypothetical protein